VSADKAAGLAKGNRLCLLAKFMQTKVQRIQSQGKTRCRAVKVILRVPFWVLALGLGPKFSFRFGFGFRFPFAALTTTNVAGNQVNSAPNCINSCLFWPDLASQPTVAVLPSCAVCCQLASSCLHKTSRSSHVSNCHQWGAQ